MKGLVGVTYPEVPERLKTRTELRPLEYRAHGFIRTYWGWSPHTVTIFIGDFDELAAAFHHIKHMRVQRIEQKSGGMAVSRNLR